MPWSVLICHCTAGAGLPLAWAESVTWLLTATVWLLGWVVTAGAKSTVRVAAVVVALPAPLVKTASNSSPFWLARAVRVSVLVLARGTLWKVWPPSWLTRQWTLGAGVPVAAAVNVTTVPALTVALVGFVVTVGGDKEMERLMADDVSEAPV